MGKGVVHLVAYLETVKADARTNLGNDICRTRTIDFRHLADGFLYNTLDCAPPPGMNGTDGMMYGVIEQYRNAVSCRYTYTEPRDISHQRINALKVAVPILINDSNLCLMHLMRHDELVITDIKQLTQQGTVLADGLVSVATVAIDVELAVAPCAESSLAGSAKCYHVGMYIVI